MVEETKEKDQALMPDGTPEKAPGEVEEKPEEPKYKETPEDVEKSREYHQQKAQEETEKRKSAETELEQIYADLEAGDPSSYSGKPPEQQSISEAEPEAGTEADEYGEQDVGKIIRSEVAKIRKDLFAENQKVQEKNEQDQIQKTWKAEQDRAVKAVRAHQKILNISDEVFNACDVEAVSYVPPANMVGTYTKWARVMKKLFEHHQLQGSITQKAKAAEADATAQVDHANKALQPGGSATSPPGAGTLEEWNRKQADDIAEDDPSVG